MIILEIIGAAVIAALLVLGAQRAYNFITKKENTTNES